VQLKKDYINLKGDEMALLQVRVKEIQINNPEISCCFCGTGITGSAGNEQWTILNGRAYCPYCAGRAVTEDDD
jgi:hypothetical protein